MPWRRFIVSFAQCTPTAIIDNENGNIVATIDSIEDGIDESVTFSKCQDDNDDEETCCKEKIVVNHGKDRATNTDVEGQRNVGTLNRNMPISIWICILMYSGLNAAAGLAPCPGDNHINQACRRHDHGIVGSRVAIM